MLSAGVVVAAGVAWLGVLFAVALYGERRPQRLQRGWALVYVLSLAIHCTSWTFYGTVTQASRSQWWLPPTFVGAMALYAIGIGLMLHLVALAREHNAASLADLIAARLGRHSGLAALATGVMLLAIIPYIALQLKAIAMSYGILVHGQAPGTPPWQDSALYVALALAVFTIVFGARRASAVVHNRGLILAVAFESLFKLLAMLVLGAMLLLPWQGLAAAPPAIGPADTSGFPSFILLGALAMFAMPHQFHVAVTECHDARHVRLGRWLFPLYLLLISLPLLPLARLGDATLGLAGVSSDLYVLALPLSEGRHGLALLAFLGGLSAATSMVVVATLALSLMVANHFIAPFGVRAGWGSGARGDLRRALLRQRRVVIVVILLLAWIYSRLLIGSDALADIGAISFSALIGLLLPTLAALWWPELGARAVGAGLLAGTLAWLYVLLPAFVPASAAWFDQGVFGSTWLTPGGLGGLDAWSPLARAVTVNLVVNGAVTLLVAQSRWARGREPRPGGVVDVVTLRTLAERFLAPEQVAALFARSRPGVAGARLLGAVEHELAAVIGAASAHLLLDVVRARRHENLEQVAEIVGEAAQDLRFNQRVLEAALENMSQGICVVDAELRVVAWNQPYALLFAYPRGLLRVGRPVAELMRANIGAGLIGPADVAVAVDRRLAHMRRGTPHHSERVLHGAVIEIRGNPMPGGGYVATFTDVTRFRAAEAELKRSNETLELRVRERTRELASATAEAQRANEAKGHFLAAVSHDLMQPLHAAQLFAETLRAQLPAEAGSTATVRHLGDALGVTEDLLASLLDIARLEGGQLDSRPRDFPLAEILEPLDAEFSALARARGGSLRVRPSTAWVRSDPQLLRRIVQNFLSNALRHAGTGRVLLAARRVANAVRIEVRDGGPGIGASEQRLIFEQFRRGSAASGQGLGLGLAIAERMAGLLGHRLSLRSRRGAGSVFAVTVPCAPAAPAAAPEVAADGVHPEVVPARALVLDNDPTALAALVALLRAWHWQVDACTTIAQALAVVARPDLLLLDYHLDAGRTGLDALHALRERHGAIPAAIVTGDRDAHLRRQVQKADVVVLHKPLKALALQQWLRRARPQGARREPRP